MRQRFVFLAIMSLVSFQINAQFKKGDRMVGTSVANVFYNSGNADVTFPSTIGYKIKSSSYGVRIEPTMAWFISENIAVGGLLNINPSGQKETVEDRGTTFQKDQSNNFNIGLGAFARYYFSNGNSYMPFGQFGFNLGISSSRTEGFRYYDAAIDYKVSYEGNSSGGFFANTALQLGLTKMIGDNAGLDFFAGYSYSYNNNTFKTVTTTDYGLDGSIDITEEDEPTTKFTNHGFFAGVGIQVFLRKKR